MGFKRKIFCIISFFLTVMLSSALIFISASENLDSGTAFALQDEYSSYTCGDIVFGDSADNGYPRNYTTDIDDLSNTWVRNRPVTSISCSMTEWNMSTYGYYLDRDFIQIGTNMPGYYHGSVKLTLKSNVTNRVIIYASSFPGDSIDSGGTSHEISLYVNGIRCLYDAIISNQPLTYAARIFDLPDYTNEIVIANAPAQSWPQRMAICKIVLRLY